MSLILRLLSFLEQYPSKLHQLSKKAPQQPTKVRLEDIEDSPGSGDTTREPSVDSVRTQLNRGSADSSVTVFSMEDVELHASEEKRRLHLEKTEV